MERALAAELGEVARAQRDAAQSRRQEMQERFDDALWWRRRTDSASADVRRAEAGKANAAATASEAGERGGAASARKRRRGEGESEGDGGGGDDDVEPIGLATDGGDGVQAASGEAR